MKSQLFKSAWKLVKELKMTMSEALTIVWASIKLAVDVNTNTSWSGQVRIVFSKSIGDSRYSCASLSDLLQKVSHHNNISLAGAANSYGAGTYNGD